MNSRVEAEPGARVAVEMQVWQRDIKAPQWSVELQDACSTASMAA